MQFLTEVLDHTAAWTIQDNLTHHVVVSITSRFIDNMREALCRFGLRFWTILQSRPYPIQLDTSRLLLQHHTIAALSLTSRKLHTSYNSTVLQHKDKQPDERLTLDHDFELSRFWVQSFSHNFAFGTKRWSSFPLPPLPFWPTGPLPRGTSIVNYKPLLQLQLYFLK